MTRRGTLRDVTLRDVTLRDVTLRDRYLRRTYGISYRQYLRMVRSQGGACAICRRRPKPGRRLHVDHDHRTGRVRGALCWFCNHKLLGRRREDPRLHEAAARYLRSTVDWRKEADDG